MIHTLHVPKYSDWKLVMAPGLDYRPLSTARIPMLFQRWLLKIFIGFEWVYDPQGYL